MLRSLKHKRPPWVAFFLLLPLAFGLPEACRVEAVGRNIQDGSQNKQLRIINASNLRFDLRDGSATDVEAAQLALRGKLFLRQAVLVAPLLDLFANDVGRLSCFSHARECELDNRRGMSLFCYDFLAMRKRQKLRKCTMRRRHVY